MGLKVWLPLNGDLTQQGASGVSIINSNATVNTSGKIGSCYYFNASSYLYENTYDWTNFNTSQFSLCCWYKQPSPVASGNSQIICIGTSSGWNNIRIGLLRRTSSGYPMFSVSNGSSAVQYNCTATTFSFDTWNHIVCTYDNGTIKIYLNGILNKTYTTTIVPVLNSSQHLGIGAASNGAEKLTGYLNDIRIYDHCLSAAEVHEISQGLVLHYKMDYIHSQPHNNSNLLPDSNANSLTKIYGPNNRYYETKGNSGYTCAFEYISDPPVPGIQFGIRQTVTAVNGHHAQTWYDGNMINVTKGNTYTLSCYVKNISQTDDMLLRFQIGDGQYTSQDVIIINDDQWHQYSWTFVPNNTDSTNNKTRIYAGGLYSIGTILICGYKLEEGSVATPWTPAEGEPLSPIILDSSGYHNHGTIIGTGNLVISPRYAYGINMSVRSSTRHIECNTLPLIATYSFWAKFAIATGQIIFADGQSKIMLATTSSKAVVQVATTSKPMFDLSTFTTNEWNHIAITKDGTTYKMYVNGAEVSTSGSNYYRHDGNALWLFNRNYNGNYGANASLADFRGYVTVLSADDIKQLYDLGAKVDNKHTFHTFELVEDTSTIKITRGGQTKAIGTFSSNSYDGFDETDSSTTKFKKNNKKISAAQFIEI